MKQLLAITKALADPSRLRVLCALATHGELCVCQLQEMLGLAPSSTSRHMALLSAAGLVDGRREGRWVYYRLAEEEVRPGLAALIEWVVTEAGKERLIRADSQRLAAICALTPEALCQLQAQGIACCSSAPATHAAAKSRKATRAPSKGR